MALIRVFLLWSIVSLHVVAGMVLFRRLFPRESPWFGFLVPALAFCILLNFIENFIAIRSLLWLLPFTTIGSILLVARSGMTVAGPAPVPAPTDFSWRELWLPLCVFLGSFAFTFFIRCVEPDILASSDGLADLNLIANFTKGETLPPTDGWMPPFKLQYYYTFSHYCASVLTRLLGVDIGTGYNLSHALVSAFTCFVAAAAAWRITGRIWITLLVPFLIESAATGSSAYLLLTEPDPSPWIMDNLSGGLEHPDNNPIWKLLATAPYRERLELQVPGFWTWRDEYHPNSAGHLLTIFSVWVLMEIVATGEKRLWPWIAAVTIPFISLLTSTWAFPITALICGGGLVIAYWQRGRTLLKEGRPINLNAVVIPAAVVLVLIWPSLQALFGAPNPPPIMWNHREWRTPPYEFLIQWWPIILPWLALCFVWPRLPVGVKWAHAAVPFMLLLIETFNIEDGRYNTIEKMWGYTYGAGLAAFFPAVAMRSGIIFRLITVLLLASATVTISGRLHSTFRWVDWSKGAWHVEGNGILRNDPQRARLLQILSQLHNATLLTGKSEWGYNDSPALATFSGNRTYIAWTWSEERYGHTVENDFRAQQVSDFYAGKMADPLGFLINHDIAAVVIWPDDQIPDDILNNLKTQLAPGYSYIDCHGDGPHNAGVFMAIPRSELGQKAVTAPGT